MGARVGATGEGEGGGEGEGEGGGEGGHLRIDTMPRREERHGSGEVAGTHRRVHLGALQRAHVGGRLGNDGLGHLGGGRRAGGWRQEDGGRRAAVLVRAGCE